MNYASMLEGIMTTRIALIVSLGVALTACQNEPTLPSSPPDPSGPQSPVTPLNPTGPSASIVTAGVYRVNAPITYFDPAWEDLTGYRYTATFAVRHHPTEVGRLIGTFSDFTLVDAEGKPSTWRISGTIEGFVDGQSRATFDLKSSEGNFTWWGRGPVTANRIDGTWGRAGHLAGPFSAELIR